MPYQGGIQLLPGTQQRANSVSSYTTGNGYFWTGIVLGLIVLVVGAILGGYARSRQDALNVLDGDFSVLEQKRDKVHEKVLIDAQQQSSTITQLLDNKVYWSQAFNRIESLLQSSVKLTQLTADADKSSIVFSATAANYTAVSRQIAAFVSATGISDITVNSVATQQNGEVLFNGEISLDSSLLAPSPTSTPTSTATPRP